MKKFNKNLCLICIWHMILFGLTVGGIGYLFLADKHFINLTTVEVFWLSLVLFGFAGALLYFSRKCYVYLINDKYFHLSEEVKDDPSKLHGRLTGYYTYLLLRPMGGIAIGPIAALIILGGLSTLSKADCGVGEENLSEAGKYLIMLAAFVGGYTSSDLFDALSKFGKSAVRPKVKS